MISLRWWSVWLQAIGVCFAGFGTFIALGNRTAAFDWAFNQHIDPEFFPEGISPEAQRFQQWSYGLLGATCVLVGILVFAIAKCAFANRQRWSWVALAVAVGVWFAIDESVSWVFGVFFNVVFNLVLIVAIAVPLALTWPEFFGRKHPQAVPEELSTGRS